ncbi:hypothetical protein Tco_1390386 [Tanacetum coccineum]
MKPRERPTHPIVQIIPNNRRSIARLRRAPPTRDLGDLVPHMDTPPDKGLLGTNDLPGNYTPPCLTDLYFNKLKEHY